MYQSVTAHTFLGSSNTSTPSGSGPNVEAYSRGAPITATVDPATIPSFCAFGLPLYRSIICGGTIAPRAGPLHADFSAAASAAIVAYDASGKSWRTRSSFSPSPFTNSSGISLVYFNPRSQIPISRPWLGRRDKSISTASGMLARMALLTAGPFISPSYSGSKPAERTVSSSGPASSGLQ